MSSHLRVHYIRRAIAKLHGEKWSIWSQCPGHLEWIRTCIESYSCASLVSVGVVDGQDLRMRDAVDASAL